MTRKYQVSFEIEGTSLADDFPLTKENLKKIIEQEFSIKGQDYWKNREIDCNLNNLKIVKSKE